MADAAELARKFAILKAQKEYHERMVKIINTDLGTIGKLFYTVCADDDIDQLRVSGDLFTDTQARVVKPEIIYRPTVANITGFHAYLREKGFGSLIKENVHPKTLESWVKKQKTANSPLPSEELLKVFEQETAKVTRAKKKADGSGSAEEEPEEILGEEPTNE